MNARTVIVVGLVAMTAVAVILSGVRGVWTPPPPDPPPAAPTPSTPPHAAPTSHPAAVRVAAGYLRARFATDRPVDVWRAAMNHWSTPDLAEANLNTDPIRIAPRQIISMRVASITATDAVVQAMCSRGLVLRVGLVNTEHGWRVKEVADDPAYA